MLGVRVVIQCDGYAGIGPVFAGPDPPKRAGCMDHARRKWVVALDAGDARAAIVVKLLAGLYAVEAEARAQGLSPDALVARRHEKSRPIMAQLRRVIGDLAAGASPKSPLGKATTYAINQWPTLEVFLDDGRVPLSKNAHVERQQRRTVLGRKNYLFSGSDDGARRLAILQTFVVNCDLAKIPMWQYLRDTLARLADGWPQSRIAELTPAAWAAAQKTAEQAKTSPRSQCGSTCATRRPPRRRLAAVPHRRADARRLGRRPEDRRAGEGSVAHRRSSRAVRPLPSRAIQPHRAAGAKVGATGRIPRNNADWHRLLEICALADTLILDEDGVYDPTSFNDRLLLGLKRNDERSRASCPEGGCAAGF